MGHLRATCVGLACTVTLTLVAACSGKPSSVTTGPHDAGPAPHHASEAGTRVDATSTPMDATADASDADAAGGDAAADAADARGGCTSSASCDGGVCTAGQCAAPTCTDHVKDGEETDVDCGGATCPACPPGDKCDVASDCASKVCTMGVCQAPSPTDGVENDSETDVDCGGMLEASGSANPASDGAPVCKTGQRCLIGRDCQQGVCAAAAVPGVDAGTTGDGGASVLLCQPPSPTDRLMNDSETDVDCGGSTSVGSDGAPACGNGLHCLVPTDCVSLVCHGAKPAMGTTPAVTGICEAPTCTDGVKNGNETDVDCGGGTCKACAAGRSCKVASDCTSVACNYAGVCVSAPSCVAQYGGDTCGPGEVGAAGAMHQDCCTTITIPRPAASGGPIVMDKYLITAGRMRVFLEAVDYNVLAYIQANRPSWWAGSGVVPPASGSLSWDDDLPTSHADFTAKTIGIGSANGSSGCTIGTTKGDVGAPAYWETAADLAVIGGAPRTYTQDEMDTKVMNCFQPALFHALCAYDGGRLPSEVEWEAARTTWSAAGVATMMAYPWPNDGAAYQTKADRESHAVYDTIGDSNYFWPGPLPPATNDYGAYLGAPGRFPSGNGPYGHSDLMGCVENMGSQPNASTPGAVMGDGWFQFSFQEAEQDTPPSDVHPYGQSADFGGGGYRSHWAVGGRCVKLP